MSHPMDALTYSERLRLHRIVRCVSFRPHIYLENGHYVTHGGIDPGRLQAQAWCNKKFHEKVDWDEEEQSRLNEIAILLQIRAEANTRRRGDWQCGHINCEFSDSPHRYFFKREFYDLRIDPRVTSGVRYVPEAKKPSIFRKLFGAFYDKQKQT